jgi:hypothetical protein
MGLILRSCAIETVQEGVAVCLGVDTGPRDD